MKGTVCCFFSFVFNNCCCLFLKSFGCFARGGKMGSAFYLVWQRTILFTELSE